MNSNKYVSLKIRFSQICMHGTARSFVRYIHIQDEMKLVHMLSVVWGVLQMLYSIRPEMMRFRMSL